MIIIAKTSEGYIVNVTKQEMLNLVGVNSTSELKTAASETFVEGANINVSETYKEVGDMDVAALKKLMAGLMAELTVVAEKIEKIPDHKFVPSLPTRRKITVADDKPAEAPSPDPPGIPSIGSIGRELDDALHRGELETIEQENRRRLIERLQSQLLRNGYLEGNDNRPTAQMALPAESLPTVRTGPITFRNVNFSEYPDSSPDPNS